MTDNSPRDLTPAEIEEMWAVRERVNAQVDELVRAHATLSLVVKSLVHDVECTRRERDSLKDLVESRCVVQITFDLHGEAHLKKDHPQP